MKLRRRITKRACIALVLFLTAGAIVNVAATWGLAILEIGFDTQESGVRSFNAAPDAKNEYSARVRFGLPVRSMQCEGHATLTSMPPTSVSMEFTDSIKTPSGFGWLGIPSGKILPTRPIWPGFAINTVFYAVILRGLYAAPFALRRRSRVKRGLCPKCAYDLRGRAPMSEVCPECGEDRMS